MEMVRLERASLRFPARCLACDSDDFRPRGRFGMPLCTRCWLRIAVGERSLLLAVSALIVSVVDLVGFSGGGTLAGLPLPLWFLGLLIFAGVAGGKPAQRARRLSVRKLDAERVELVFADPQLAAEVMEASATGTPYRGVAPSALPRLRGSSAMGWATVVALGGLALGSGLRGHGVVAFFCGLFAFTIGLLTLAQRVPNSRLNQPISPRRMWRSLRSYLRRAFLS